MPTPALIHPLQSIHSIGVIVSSGSNSTPLIHPIDKSALTMGNNTIQLTNQDVITRYSEPGKQHSHSLYINYGVASNKVTTNVESLFVGTPITLSNFGPFNLNFVSGGTFTLPQPTSNSNSPGTFSYSVPANNGVVSIALPGINWALRTSPADYNWYSVAYGNRLWVAVASSGKGDRVMTSPDGINWTLRASATDNLWRSVVYGNGLWVAVALSGEGNRVMTSPDGITWTSRTSAADNTWISVAYGNGLFVAIAQSGIGNRVMTSPDGINWTSRKSADDKAWRSVAYGNGLWVAVAAGGTGYLVMTSPDGINWTSRKSPANNNWISVAYGNGLWVAVAYTGVGNRVMTSPDGINWTIRTSAADNNWSSVVYGNGLWVAVAFTGVGNRVMTSPDGITWTSRKSAADNGWFSVAYGNGLFVAVPFAGAGNNVMTSGYSINIVGVGTTTITAIQNAAGGYASSTPITANVTVLQQKGFSQVTNSAFTNLNFDSDMTTLFTNQDSISSLISMPNNNFIFGGNPYSVVYLSSEGALYFNKQQDEYSWGMNNQLPVSSFRFFGYDHMSTGSYKFDSNNTRLLVKLTGYAWGYPNHLFTIKVIIEQSGNITTNYTIGSAYTYYPMIIGYVGSNSAITSDDIFLTLDGVTFNGSTFLNLFSLLNGKTILYIPVLLPNL